MYLYIDSPILKSPQCAPVSQASLIPSRSREVDESQPTIEMTFILIVVDCIARKHSASLQQRKFRINNEINHRVMHISHQSNPLEKVKVKKLSYSYLEQNWRESSSCLELLCPTSNFCLVRTYALLYALQK